MKELNEMKKKLQAERDQFRKDQADLEKELSMTQETKKKLFEANEMLDTEKQKNMQWSERLKKLDEDQKARYKHDKAEVEKARKVLARQQEKTKKEQSAIEEDKARIQAVVKEKITQFKKELIAAKTKLRKEEEALEARKAEIAQRLEELEGREKKVTEETSG